MPLFGQSRAIQIGGLYVFNADFSTLDLSTSSNAAAIKAAVAARGGASSWTYTRASVSTVRTSINSVVTSGIGVDDPIVGDAGFGRGLVIDPSSTNRCIRSNAIDTGWADVSGTVTFGADIIAPDGGLAKSAIDDSVALAEGRQLSPTAAAGPHTFSAWVKPVSGSVPLLRYINAVPTTFDVYGDGTADWRRFSVTDTSASNCNSIRYFPGAGNPVAAASVGENGIWGVQLENQRFMTELIVTTGAAATRAASRLELASSWIAAAASNGRIGIYFKMIPKFNIADCPANSYLWRTTAGQTDYCHVNSTGVIQIAVNGVASTFTSGNISFARGDIVEIFMEVGNGTPSCKWRVNGGATTACGFSVVAHANIATANSWCVGMITGATNHFPMWLQQFALVRSGSTPF